MERVVGGEADAGEHLLAVRGDGARGAAGDRLGERGGLGAGVVGGRARARPRAPRSRRAPRRAGGARPGTVPIRPAELHPLDGVGAREVEHGAARAGDLVRERAPTERHCGVPGRIGSRSADGGRCRSMHDAMQPPSGSMPRTGSRDAVGSTVDGEHMTLGAGAHTTSSSVADARGRRGRRRARADRRRGRAASHAPNGGSSTARSARARARARARSRRRAPSRSRWCGRARRTRWRSRRIGSASSMSSQPSSASTASSVPAAPSRRVADRVARPSRRAATVRPRPSLVARRGRAAGGR